MTSKTASWIVYEHRILVEERRGQVPGVEAESGVFSTKPEESDDGAARIWMRLWLSARLIYIEAAAHCLG